MTIMAKTKWFPQTRGTVELYRIGLPFKAMCFLGTEITGSPITTMLYMNIDGKLWWCWDEENLITLGKKILGFSNSKSDLDQRLKKYDLYINQALVASDSIRSSDLSQLTKDELIKKINYLYEESKYFHALLNCDIDAFDIYPVEYLQKKVHEELSKVGGESDISNLMSAICISYLQHEEQAINEGAQRWLSSNKTDTDLDILSEGIFEKFWWTSLGWESMNIKFLDFFKDKIITQSKLDEKVLNEKIKHIETELEEKKEIRKGLIKKYSVNDEIVKILEMFDIYAVYHDKRKEVQMKVMYSFDLLRREILKYIPDVSANEEWFWPEELNSISSLKKELKERGNSVAVYYKNGQINTYSGYEAREIFRREIDNDNDHPEEIRGMVAYKGVVIGKVKVCNGAIDAQNKIEEGDILVTGMTLPDYVPSMKKAGAIITNEGGITSHAAIVARELKKPCIIGTKIATKVLKDGDLVEVNADNGTVKIIERNQ